MKARCSMKSVSIITLFVALAFPAFAPGQPAGQTPDVQTIVNKANGVAYYQGEDGKASVKMTITNKQGQKRQPEFNILRKDVADGGDQKYFVYFHRPPDVRGMAYMVHKHTDPGKDDDRWLFLPALSLVKRIAASDKRTSFVGSDFLYEDVSGRSLEEDTHELIETTDALFVVKNVPKQPDSVEFGYFNVSIDRKTFVPMKMDFYDKEGKLYRTIESTKVEMIQDFPTVVKSVASNLQTGGKTEMEFGNVKYNIGLKDDIFTERYLQRPPREAMR
ncbi:MAG: outer membrane lipoprotein-sorting protein [Planctomycetes bacterium RBG_16_55_9]|nr:MAG: outer membrane lipoprotein-sorting protein [Planctomycetes bacterium RBG_16_55_9]